jgi:hypothetical protein
MNWRTSLRFIIKAYRSAVAQQAAWLLLPPNLDRVESSGWEVEAPINVQEVTAPHDRTYPTTPT